MDTGAGERSKRGRMSARRPLRSAVVMVATLLAALAAVFSAGAQAAPGNLDPTFSGDGKQTTDFLPGGDSDATATVRQPDGKIVAVGSVFRRSSGDSSFFDFALARYNPNGTLDTSFSGDGRKTTDFAGIDDDRATGVALQSDGKIVVVGGTGVGSPFGDIFDFAVARYNPNGTLDTSFSGDGKQTADLGDIDIAYGTTVQGDGKIVVVGNVSQLPSGATDFALARFDSNGSLDTSFSGDGKQTTDFG